MKLLTTIFFLFSLSNLLSQFNSREIDTILIQAKGKYFANKYAESLPFFITFLEKKPTYIHSNTYYFIANAYLKVENNQKAMFFLNKFVDKSGYSYYTEFSQDSSWMHLNKYKEWGKILAKIKKNEQTRFKNFEKNKEIMTRLTQIMEDDQTSRLKIEEFEEKYGKDSPKVDSLWKMIAFYDSINQLYVTDLLDKNKKWFGPNEIGYENCLSLFLVIQHADIKVQEKYHEMMKKAVFEEKIDIQSFAMFEDRVLIGHNKKQLYGTQFGFYPESGKRFLYPIEKPEELNFRRELIGMGAMEYVWEEWSLEKYYEELPLVEKLIKK